jgi:hypothetical protein
MSMTPNICATKRRGTRADVRTGEHATAAAQEEAVTIPTSTGKSAGAGKPPSGPTPAVVHGELSRAAEDKEGHGRINGQLRARPRTMVAEAAKRRGTKDDTGSAPVGHMAKPVGIGTDPMVSAITGGRRVAAAATGQRSSAVASGDFRGATATPTTMLVRKAEGPTDAKSTTHLTKTQYMLTATQKRLPLKILRPSVSRTGSASRIP